MELHAGLMINANVELTRPLGSGGMGSVWVAQHRTLRTEVAVKFVDAELAALEPTLLTRFEREASTAAQIKSPHVVQMFDHGVCGGVPYIVMELLEGESLEERLRRSGRLSIEEVSVLLRQCAEALHKAHTLGIIHRDLKPANLFLIDTGYDLFVKVLDFGIAKQTGLVDLQEVTASMAVVGTPKYMSLEQLVDTKNVTHSTDLWALAVIAYRALTGTVPFDADTLPGLTMRVLQGAFTPVTQLDPSLPPGLDAWFVRALQNNAGDRFASATELAETFLAAIRGEAVSVPVPPTDLSATVAMAPPVAQTLPSAVAPVFAPSPSGSTVSAVTSSARAESPAGSWGARLAVLLVVASLAGGGAFFMWRTTGEDPAPPTTAAVTSEPVESVDESAGDAATSDAVASAVPIPPASSAAASAAPSTDTTATAKTPRWRPPPAPPPVVSTQPKPARCTGNDAFYRNPPGRLVARPECL